MLLYMRWQEHAQIMYLLLYQCHMYTGIMAQVICRHNPLCMSTLIQFPTTTVQDKSQYHLCIYVESDSRYHCMNADLWPNHV